MRGMQGVIIGLAALALHGCGKDISPEEQERMDERDIAMVEQANKAPPPLREVTPDPILAGDRERYAIKPGGCSFSPGFSLSERIITLPVVAYAKIDNEMQRFAADVGSADMPAGTRAQYFGKLYSLQLSVTPDTGEDGEPADAEGSVTLRDAQGRVVYSGTGTVHCADDPAPAPTKNPDQGGA